jgi:hypothetical protein
MPTPTQPTPTQQVTHPPDNHPHQAAPTPATTRPPRRHPAIPGTYGTIADAVWTCDEDTDDDLIAATWTPRD